MSSGAEASEAHASVEPCAGGRCSRSMVARSLLVLISWYQAARAGRPSPCRYWPSCSNYAREAIEVHGAGRGVWLTARRLSRCHPLGGKGVDPVPAARSLRGRAA